jgi:NAD+ kinase
MVVPRPHAGTAIVVDGIVLSKVLPSDRVRVRRSEAKFQLLAVPGHSYYRTLREKLGWGGRLQINEL